MFKPTWRPKHLLTDLLYSESPNIKRLPGAVVQIRANKYMKETGISNTASFRQYLDALRNDGYVRDYTWEYAVVTVEIVPPPIVWEALSF